MRSTLRHATFAVCTGMIMLALTALPARAIDINNLPDWVRDSIHPVEIDWSQVYPGLAAPPAWAQEAAGLQEVRPRPLAGLETVSPAAGPSGVGTLPARFRPNCRQQAFPPACPPSPADG